MGVFRHGFGKTIPESLDHNRGIVVMFVFVFLSEVFHSFSGANRKGSEVIPDLGILWSNEIGEAMMRLIGQRLLATQKTKSSQWLILFNVLENFNVIAY